MSQAKPSPELPSTLSLHLGISQEQQGNLCPQMGVGLGLARFPWWQLVAFPARGQGCRSDRHGAAPLAQLLHCPQ